jgi:Tfp pilus assembly protein PilN
MMRANLLPRPKEKVDVFGFELDAEYVRQSVAGLCLVAAVAALGIGIEYFRMQRLEAAIATERQALAANAAQSAEARRLAVDVARFQALARAADAFRRSGNDAAIGVARIGNALPDRVWLDALTRKGTGYELSGTARSVDALGTTMHDLGAALPEKNPGLLSIDNRDSLRTGVTFSAQVNDRETPPPAVSSGSP